MTSSDAISISVQTDDFDVSEESNLLRERSSQTGAIVTFTGIVRDFAYGSGLTALELEHYPGMTESALREIAVEAQQRWPVLAITIIHRVGKLALRDQIVLVVISSQHRENAFKACEFVMDYLKTDAPFWKKEYSANGESWVQQQQKDRSAKQRWQTSNT